jgi:hypothetical protein
VVNEGSGRGRRGGGARAARNAGYESEGQRPCGCARVSAQSFGGGGFCAGERVQCGSGAEEAALQQPQHARREARRRPLTNESDEWLGAETKTVVRAGDGCPPH